MSRFTTRMKKFIFHTPLNRNYIADLSLKRRLKETIPYVSGLVLDVGCGEKPYEHLYGSKVKTYIGIDLPTSHTFYSPNTRHADVYGVVDQLPFKSSSFNAIIFTEVLPHVEYPPVAFTELTRVLKSEGVLVVTANKSWERRTGLPVPDLWRFTDEGLAQLARQQGLEVLYTKEGCGFFATMGQLFSRFLNKEFIYRKVQHRQVDHPPNMLAALLVLPLMAFIQIFFLLLDKIYYSKLDTIFYIMLARKK